MRPHQHPINPRTPIQHRPARKPNHRTQNHEIAQVTKIGATAQTSSNDGTLVSVLGWSDVSLIMLSRPYRFPHQSPLFCSHIAQYFRYSLIRQLSLRFSQRFLFRWSSGCWRFKNMEMVVGLFDLSLANLPTDDRV